MRLSYPSLGQSLGNRLFLWVLGAALAALGGTSYLSYKALEHSAHNQIQSQLSTQTQRIESQLGQVEAYSIGLATAVKANYQNPGTTEKVYEQLAFEYFKRRPDLIMAIGFGQTPQALQPDHQWLYHYFYLDQGVAGAKGHFLPPPYNNVRYSELFADDNYPTQDYYKLPTQSGNNLWVQPYDWYGVTMTSFMVPIKAEQGTVLGVVGADVNVSALRQLIDSPVLNHQGFYAILSEQGNLLAYPPDPSKARERVNYEQIPALKSVWTTAQRASAGLFQENGQIWAYQRVKGTQWLMIAQVSQGAVIQPILLSTVLGAIEAGTFLSIAVALFVRQLNRRLKPILTICEQLQTQYAPINFSQPRPPTGDELSILSSTVHRMAQQLQAAFRDLAQSNDALEQRVQERAEELSHTLHHLQTTQLQMVQSEKMSALGNLVASVAHEINNPISFIGGNLYPATTYINSLFGLIDLYQEQYPGANLAIETRIEDIDLPYLRQDLPQLIGSMNVGVDRIQAISKSLRTFSRADTDRPTRFDLHEGLNSTLMILKHRLQGNQLCPEIIVVKHYGELPEIECFAGQINQVFMNLIANAIDALEERRQVPSEQSPDRDCITITTATQGDTVQILVGDNGPGMAEGVRSRVFDHLFTTKPVGQGTGLGLSIVYQIVTEKHLGRVEVRSEPDQGTTFVVTLPVKQVLTDAPEALQYSSV